MQHVVGAQRSQPLAGPVEGLGHPLRRYHLEVPLAGAGVHSGDHHVPGLAEGPVGVEGGLGHRFRVAALRAQGAPAAVGLRPPGFDLDDAGLVAEDGHDSRCVHVARNHQRRAEAQGDHTGVVPVGGFDVPTGAAHGPQHHRLQGVPRLQDGQGLLGGSVGHRILVGLVPEGAAAVARRRGPDLQRPVLAEAGVGAGVDVGLALNRRGHFLAPVE